MQHDTASLRICHELLAISREMLKRAKAQEWDELTACEKRRATIVSGMPALSAGLGAAASIEMAKLMTEMQACDQEVSAYVMAWRNHVDQWLSPGSQQTQAGR